MALSNGDKVELMLLWKEAFGDTDEYISLFFNRVYQPDNTLVVRRKGQIAAALQLVDYEMKVGESVLRAAYICGVCTRMSERGNGLMKRLFREANEVITARGFDCAFLIPALPFLFDVYRRLGFVYTFGKRHFLQRVADVSVVHRPFFEGDRGITTFSEHFFGYFHGEQLKRGCAVLHNERDFQTIIRDCELSGGRVFTLIREGCPEGMAFTEIVPDGGVLVSELFFSGLDVREMLVDAVGRFFSTDVMTVRTPDSCLDDSCQVSDYGLARFYGVCAPPASPLFFSLMLD